MKLTGETARLTFTRHFEILREQFVLGKEPDPAETDHEHDEIVGQVAADAQETRYAIAAGATANHLSVCVVEAANVFVLQKTRAHLGPHLERARQVLFGQEAARTVPHRVAQELLKVVLEKRTKRPIEECEPAVGKGAIQFLYRVQQAS